MRRTLLLVLVGLLLAGAAVPAPGAGATDGLAQLWFEPDTVQAEQGETFTVDLVVDSQPQFASGAHEVGVVVDFNETYVRATDIERGPFISQGENTTIETNRSNIDNDGGFLVYDLHREPAKGGVTGEGVFATVTFEVRADAPDGSFDLRYTSARILLTDGNLQRATADPANVTVGQTGPTTTTEATSAPGISPTVIAGVAIVVVAVLFGGVLFAVRRL